MSTTTRELWIIGTGGHARVIIDLARACGYRVAGFVEPAPVDEHPGFMLGLPVVVGMDALRDLGSPAFTVAIGHNRLRRETAAVAIKLGARPVTLIHPTAIVEETATVGDGAQVCLGAILASACTVGPDAIINSGAIIEHECDIGPGAHICPGVRLAGRVRVGEAAMVGLGACVVQNITIGEGAIVGAGAVVLDDVPAGATVVGVPARPTASGD